MTTVTTHPTPSPITDAVPAPTVAELVGLAATAAADLAVLADREPTGRAALAAVHRILVDLVGSTARGQAIVGDPDVVMQREVAVLLRRLGRVQELPAPTRRRAVAELEALATMPRIR